MVIEVSHGMRVGIWICRSAANFYVFYGWLPSYIAAKWKVPTELTLGK
jgi:hypothetical protein